MGKNENYCAIDIQANKVKGTTLKQLSILTTGIALTLGALPVLADNEFKINGFINVIGSISDSETEYANEIADKVNFDSTNLGIVLTKNINSKLSVATQLIGKNEVFGFDWGYINYKINSELSAKAGRIKYAGNLVSETFDVGVTYPWVRPPISIYGDRARLSFEAYNGASIVYMAGDDIEYSAELIIGDAESEDITNEGLLGVVLTAATDNIQLRASYNNTTMKLDNFNPSNPNQVLMEGKSMDTFGFGLKAEYDIATVYAEYAFTSMPQNLENIGWYVTALHQMGQWTPHITFQDYDNMFGRDQNSYILGLNRQLDTSTALKFELEFIDPTNKGFFEDVPVESSITIFNISLNMVF